ncbi:exported hypothetical protein [uncultured Mycobacterium sp.]|uniref:Uncharacterized protein n=1 Tax=uncultured Mycobacterium sp. TaxID=171292 RepID=A0A1Y5PGI0_9MYCO|nr:exported hypothetical protein [uncultured Mycobacterium sp.]
MRTVMGLTAATRTGALPNPDSEAANTLAAGLAVTP